MTRVLVSGNPSAEEVAAVLAVVTSRPAPTPEDAYRRWRRTRLAALRPVGHVSIDPAAIRR
jgi:hypothetical protein